MGCDYVVILARQLRRTKLRRVAGAEGLWGPYLSERKVLGPPRHQEPAVFWHQR
jgi:hypothetical protein